MEHEDYFSLMMDALDGELSAEDELGLESHLRACPSCKQEWQAMAAIDALFRQSPMLTPAAGFTQRTLARLPNRQVRLWAMGAVYVTLLFSGLIPILLIFLAAALLSPLAQQPAVLDSVTQLVSKGWQLVAVIFSGLFNGLGQFVIEQPMVLGWLLVMAGVVFLWSGILRQLLNQPTQQQSHI
ncbi:MAG: hypothetical protein GY796_31110 [Chloroflexi bacterium]|nr:hypothetical protein [Chloroflexota bacterium]